MKKDAPRGFVFFPQDYFGDIAVRLMPSDLRIFWVEALFIMADSPDRGVLLQKNGKPYTIKDLAQAMNMSIETATSAHTYVLDKGIASIDRRSKALMSRKMVRDEMRRKSAQKNAKKGGNPALFSKKEARNGTSATDANNNHLGEPVNRKDIPPDIPIDIPRARAHARVPDPDPDPDSPRPIHDSSNPDSPVSVSPLLVLGEFHRVTLTPDEHEKLLARLNGSLQHYIDRFDRWMDESTNAKGKLPPAMAKRKAYNTILNWYDQDVKDGKIHGAHTGNRNGNSGTATVGTGTGKLTPKPYTPKQ